MFTRKTLVVLLVLAIALLTASFVTRSVTIPAADRSYDSIEQVRARPDGPSGYEQVEILRSQRRARPLAVDSSYDVVEHVRLQRPFSADHSYDTIESLRLDR